MRFNRERFGRSLDGRAKLARKSTAAPLLAALVLLLSGCDGGEAVAWGLLAVIIVIFIIFLVVMLLPEEMLAALVAWLVWLFGAIWEGIVAVVGAIWAWLSETAWPYLVRLFWERIWPFFVWLFRDKIWGFLRNWLWPKIKWVIAAVAGNALWDWIKAGWDWLWGGGPPPKNYYPPVPGQCPSGPITLTFSAPATETENDYPGGQTAAVVAAAAAAAATASAKAIVSDDLQVQMNAILCTPPCKLAIVSGPTFVVTAGPTITTTSHLYGLYVGYTATVTVTGTVVVRCQ